MYKKDDIYIMEQYRQIYVKENLGGAQEAPPATLPTSDGPVNSNTDIIPDVDPTVPTGDNIEITGVTAVQPAMGSPYENLVNQILQELSRANNLTPQEIENVTSTLRKAKFDA